MNGPLGKYSQIVAAGVSVAVIGAAVVSRPLGFADSFIDNVALIAVGAIFGSFATVNGLKQPVQAAHLRLDALGAPQAEEAGRLATHTGGSTHDEGPFTPSRPS